MLFDSDMIHDAFLQAVLSASLTYWEPSFTHKFLLPERNRLYGNLNKYMVWCRAAYLS